MSRKHESANLNSKLEIYIAGGGWEYINWMNATTVLNIEKADMVVFTGGPDVDPSLYNKRSHPRTSSAKGRDEYEKGLFDKALANHLPMVGICRGAQFLCVMAGGQLVQHQKDKCDPHVLITSVGEPVFMNSSHHQAQYPWNIERPDWSLLAWTVDYSPFHHGETEQEELVVDVVEGGVEVEIARYHTIQALCIQGHPEWLFNMMRSNKACEASIEYCRNLLERHILGQL